MELLVVIAITAILMTIILVPVIQSFNLTRTAQGWADAQDKARTLTERIAHEVSNAAYVRNNSGVNGELDIVVPNPAGALPGYDPSHGWARVPIFNAKLDLIMPAEGDPSLTRAGAFVNPITGMADPTLRAPRGQMNLPTSPGTTLVRYFVGLRDPMRRTSNGAALAGYIEPYTGLLEQRQGIRDNLYVLYRAQVQPMVWSNNQNKFVVNKAFFYDLGRNSATGKTGPLYDDPMFFDPAAVTPDDPYYQANGAPIYDIPDPDGTADPTKTEMVQNWLRVATIQTEVSRFDMIQPVYDMRTRQVEYDANGPKLMTLIQFRPARVSAEPSEGEQAARLGEESEGSKYIAPDVYQSKFPGWSNSILSFFPTGYVAGGSYVVGLNPGTEAGLDLWVFSPPLDGLAPMPGMTPAGFKLLDDAMYRESLRNNVRAPFSRGLASANYFDIASGRGNWLSDQPTRDNFTGFYADPNRGRARFSYNISEVGIVDPNPPFAPTALPDPINNPNNLPGMATWDPTKTGAGDPSPDIPKSPFNDYPRTGGTVDLSAGTFSDLQYSTINRRFNKIWFDYPALRGNIHRFLDLRVTPNSDGAPSPLNPDPMMGFSRTYIVPGSDVVYGPDQNPGANYGHPVRYWRTTHEPGPNQYRINYTDLPEPDYTLLGFPNPVGPYSPTDFVKAVLQPRYKAGYIQFDSDPNVPLPGDDPTTPGVNEAQILVSYRFQFTHPDDAVVVDYDSRQLMTVQMTIRNYPQSTVPNPQSITLYSQASVRNFVR